MIRSTFSARQKARIRKLKPIYTILNLRSNNQYVRARKKSEILASL
jgi:hypothetical protein